MRKNFKPVGVLLFSFIFCLIQEASAGRCKYCGKHVLYGPTGYSAHLCRAQNNSQQAARSKVAEPPIYINGQLVDTRSSYARARLKKHIVGNKQVIGVTYTYGGAYCSPQIGMRLYDTASRTESIALIYPKNLRAYSKEWDNYFDENMETIPLYPPGPEVSRNMKGLWIKWMEHKKSVLENSKKEAVLYGELSSLFGVKLGEQIDVSKLTIRMKEKDWDIYNFSPESKFLTFDEYELYVTPKTHTVFRIQAYAPRSEENFLIAKGAIEEKFQAQMKRGMFIDEYELLGWVGAGENKKERQLKLKGGYGLKMSLLLEDRQGFRAAEEESKEDRMSKASEAAKAL